MGYGKLGAPRGTPQDKPTPAEELAAEQERVRKLELELEARKAAEAAQKEAYESALQRRFQEGQGGAPPLDRSAEFYAAQEELNITDEDLVENGAESVRKIAEYVAAQRSREDQEKLLPVIANLTRQSYRLQLKELSSDPYWEDLGPLVENYFAENPDEMMREGRVQDVYHQLIGKNLPELQKRAAARQAAQEGVSNQKSTSKRREAPTLPSIRTEPPGRDIQPVARRDSTISEEEKYIMERFNQYGLDLDEEEFAAISKGHVLPKSRRASDWQGGIPRDANVTNYASREYDIEEPERD